MPGIAPSFNGDGALKGHGVCSQDNLCQLPLQVTHVRLQFDDLLLQLLDLRLCSSVRCSRRLRGKRPGDEIEQEAWAKGCPPLRPRHTETRDSSGSSSSTRK